MLHLAFPLLLVAVASGQDDVEFLPGQQSDVDATPYVEALVTRFLACLEAEGTTFDEADEDLIEQAISVMVPALSNAGASSCTESDAAVADCASAVSIRSCESLHDELAAVLSGHMTIVDVPAWAAAYASAMSGRVAGCYEAETGTPLAVEEQEDLTLFESMIGQTMGALTQACSVREDSVDACVLEAGAMDCAALATYLASDEVDLMVRDFMASCEGALDCGYLQ
jgi:hypothetical protein